MQNLIPLPLLAFLCIPIQTAQTAEEAAAPELIVVDTSQEPVHPGKFAPNWQSLAQYEVPEWFRDAKFGIWAHWGPQCQPERGDWYARHMYSPGHWQYDDHLRNYGHPSQVGFKDVIHAWKAQNWNPDELVELYHRAGAQYFFAMANHHDNLDMWDSKYQPWNSVDLGPQKNIIAGWAKAARERGLRFGVSVHAAHAWLWYETAQGADREGPHTGVPYDGQLTRADGKDQWWEGLDPQELYEQRHKPSPDFQSPDSIFPRWNWDRAAGGSLPDQAYCDRFYNRTIDLINKCQPDLLYFDDTGLPLWPISDAGLKIAAHFYNSNMVHHDGQLEAVLFGKILTPEQRKCLVWDIERGASNQIEPFPWQTDTCLGGWHYDRGVYERREYKSAATVIHMLADIVSKNGNLLLNVPVRADGTIDDEERRIVAGITAWMDVNREAIFGTRPWKVFGEGPALDAAASLSGAGFNEGKGKAFKADDIRFTTKGDALYAILLGVPQGQVNIKSLGTDNEITPGKVTEVMLLGSDAQVDWKQNSDELSINPPTKSPTEHSIVYKITLAAD
jgi:alpha-L-fucosidase